MSDLTKVAIVRPQLIAMAKGIHSTKSRGYPQPIRFTQAEIDLIREECKHTLDPEHGDMTLSNFVRWCAVQVAKELQRERKERNDDVHDH